MRLVNQLVYLEIPSNYYKFVFFVYFSIRIQNDQRIYTRKK